MVDRMSYLPFDQSNLAVESGGNLASIAATDMLNLRLAEMQLLEARQTKMLALLENEPRSTSYGYSSRDCLELR
jgi:hypothetical protein